MEIKCQECGNLNRLGRIFCTKCGVKLNLSEMSFDSLEEGVAPDRHRGARIARALVFLLVAAVFALALWPRSWVSLPVSRDGYPKVTREIRLFQEANRTGQSRTATISESDLNAYLAAKAGTLNVAALGVSLANQRFTFRVVNIMDGLHIGKKTLGPFLYSYEVVGSFAQGVPRIRRASIGHLPLPGPAGAFLVRRLMSAFRKDAGEPVWFDKASDIQVFDGKVQIAVKG